MLSWALKTTTDRNHSPTRKGSTRYARTQTFPGFTRCCAGILCLCSRIPCILLLLSRSLGLGGLLLCSLLLCSWRFGGLLLLLLLLLCSWRFGGLLLLLCSWRFGGLLLLLCRWGFGFSLGLSLDLGLALLLLISVCFLFNRFGRVFALGAGREPEPALRFILGLGRGPAGLLLNLDLLLGLLYSLGLRDGLCRCGKTTRARWMGVAEDDPSRSRNSSS